MWRIWIGGFIPFALCGKLTLTTAHASPTVIYDVEDLRRDGAGGGGLMRTFSNTSLATMNEQSFHEAVV